MEKLKFYEVSSNYVDYLKLFEPKIPNVDYTANNKFVCGVVLSINDINYFAPVSSFKKPQKTNIVITNSKGFSISSIRFCFMFPIPETEIDIKDFSKEEYKYKRLLMEELKFCNINKEEIRNKANYIYKRVNVGKDIMLVQNCCNFKLLEEKYLEYQNYLESIKEVAITLDENIHINIENEEELE